ncbi:MAG TPA: hypothetical protein VN446_09555 [Candidatus Acidoferrum sp.]|nr:hypothetical protein [Candidatus Acidoferrum sp.]
MKTLLKHKPKMMGIESTPVFMGGFSPRLSGNLLQIRQYSLCDNACLNKNPLYENCLHLTPSNFRAIFVTADTALLTQGTDNKAKSAEKGRRQAVWGRLPSS